MSKFSFLSARVSWVALLLVIPLSVSSSPSAAAANVKPPLVSCKASAKSGSVKLGSKVAGDLVTICASRDLLKKLVKPVPVTKPVAKPAAKKPVVKTPTVKKPAVKKPVAKVTKPKVVTKKKSNNSAAAFRAVRPVATRSPAGVLKVGQSVTFHTKLGERLARTTLLGQPVQVRFRPTQAVWTLGDGGEAAGTAVSHAYQSRGTYQVTLRVRYAVAYRAVGGSWVPDSTPIWLAGAPLTVPVGVNPSVSGQASVVLIPSP